MKKYLKISLVLLLTVGFYAGCDGVLNPSVDQQKNTEEAINSASDLEAFIYGVHDVLNRTSLFGRDFYVGPEAMSDNAFSNGNSGRFLRESRLDFPVTHGYPLGVWSNFYAAISNANIVINSGMEGSSAKADHHIGQAYALRAFSHMNLLLAFGQQYVTGGDASLGIPYVTTYNEGNFFPERDPIAAVWSNIEDDFSAAVSLMDPQFDSSPTTIGYFAVRALQSRFYLFVDDSDAAIAAADDVINNSGLGLVAAEDLVATWTSGSGPSSLWELAFTDTDRLGTDNIARILRDTNYGDVEVTEDLYNAYDASDARRDLFSADGDEYRMVNKYSDELGTDNVRLVRFAEVLLNKAEALSRRNAGADRAEALTIINNLSSERGSGTVYTEGTPENVLAERRLELAIEGQRLYDLARHGLDIRNTYPTSGNTFNNGNDLPFGSYQFALPIPNAEMDANPNMDQNEGYN